MTNETLNMAETAEVAAVEAQSLPAIRIPTRHNAALATLVERVNADQELVTLWRCANVNSVDRMGRSDHGRVHVQIVANIALKLLRLLIEADVQPGIVRDHGLSQNEAEVVVFLAAVLHDVGIAVHRQDHEQHSLFVAAPKAKELLAGLYDVEQRTTIWAETMHAIIAHNRDVPCLTVEAGVVKVADALDMAKGRSRIPFEAGQINIHSLSAAAIERVTIARGEDKPINITIDMANSAGLFQIDELLKRKLSNSGLSQYVEVVGTVREGEEKRMLQVFRL
ncbi:MAG: HD domain-containing protein [Chloroflexi bacterium]|nr:HD domain-containing protein [Chloroflexota bacterium]MCL5109451.1 HD domain-containing protein [Chloroflexota bacterium]